MQLLTPGEATPFDVDLRETLTRVRAGPALREADHRLWGVFADWLEERNFPGDQRKVAFIREHVPQVLEIMRRFNRPEVYAPISRVGHCTVMLFMFVGLEDGRRMSRDAYYHTQESVPVTAWFVRLFARVWRTDFHLTHYDVPYSLLAAPVLALSAVCEFMEEASLRLDAYREEQASRTRKRARKRAMA
jgi:hypothetical protein